MKIIDNPFVTELKAKDDEILELFKMCNEKDKEIEKLQNIINELETYIDKMSYAPVVNNPKKDLVKILKRVDKE